MVRSLGVIELIIASTLASSFSSKPDVSHALHLLRNPRDHLQNRFQRPHLSDLLELVPEILQRKRIFPDLLLELPGLLLIKGSLCLFDQGKNIAHPQNPRGHPVRMKDLQGIEFFSHPDELDGLLRHRPDRKGGPSSCVPIHLGQDDAVDAQSLVEVLGDIDGILPGHGIGHQDHLFGLEVGLDLSKLQHQRLIDVEPSGRIDQDQVIASLEGRLPPLQADVQGGLGGFRPIEIDPQVLSQFLELVDGCRPIDVCRNEVRALLSSP